MNKLTLDAQTRTSLILDIAQELENTAEQAHEFKGADRFSEYCDIAEIILDRHNLIDWEGE